MNVTHEVYGFKNHTHKLNIFSFGCFRLSSAKSAATPNSGSFVTGIISIWLPIYLWFSRKCTQWRYIFCHCSDTQSIHAVPCRTGHQRQTDNFSQRDKARRQWDDHRIWKLVSPPSCAPRYAGSEWRRIKRLVRWYNMQSLNAIL